MNTDGTNKLVMFLRYPCASNPSELQSLSFRLGQGIKGCLHLCQIVLTHLFPLRGSSSFPRRLFQYLVDTARLGSLSFGVVTGGAGMNHICRVLHGDNCQGGVEQPSEVVEGQAEKPDDAGGDIGRYLLRENSGHFPYFHILTTSSG